jgi:predicted ATPase
MLKSIRLQNFFGFQDCTINLEKGANVLVGINGSGKSNFFKAIKLLRSTLNPSEFNNYFLKEWGGFESVTNFSNRDYQNIALDFVFDPKRMLQFSNSMFNDDLCFEIAIKKIATTLNYAVDETVFLKKRNESDNKILFKTSDGNTEILERLQDGPKYRSLSTNDRDLYLGRLYDSTRLPEITSLNNSINTLFSYDQFDTSTYSSIRRASLANSEKRLSTDGSNLTSLIQTFKSNDKDTLKKIVEVLRSINDKYIDIDYGPIGGGNIELQLLEAGFRKNIPAAHISDGTLKFLCLMAILHNPNRGSVVCIDEPELGLHPDMISTLYDAIKFASETSQVIVSTHSAHLLDYFELQQIRIFEKDDNNATIVNQVTKDDFEGWYETFNPGQMWRAGDFGGNRW